MLYAHTPNDDGQWHELADHLEAVAKLAAEFADKFGQRDLARLIGFWHDLGKANPAFQQYLIQCDVAKAEGRKGPQSSVPHAIWGAAYARQVARSREVFRWADIVLPILGHHSQLSEPSTGATQRVGEFLEQHPHALTELVDFDRVLRTSLATPIAPLDLPVMADRDRELLIRMLFSVLIDADRLDTEAHFDSPRSGLRRRSRPTLAQLNDALERHIEKMFTENAVLDEVRREVHGACVASAKSGTGIFRLTVPTGGGKTLSSLAFALAHALHGTNDLKSVVVALPYTSIIEQNARVYREIPGFGDDAVLEHHSAVEIGESLNESQREAAIRAQCSAENWDVPIVVTTTVQLFESLFSNRPSKVRKLHRLARSVIILDEIQALPTEVLLPTLDVLRQLATPVADGGYGSTVVMCTATQPSFDAEPLAKIVEQLSPQEIVPGYREHFARLRRVEYRWDRSPQPWDAIADRVREHRQTMVVLNTRRDAIALLDAFGDAPHWRYHLSALLCQAHRRRVLEEIQRLLEINEPVQLVATQVVECGVDIDFPTVFRAVGPLDRIVQVAGRCNRHFRRETGEVIIFDPAQGSSPRGPYKIGTGLSAFLMRDRDPEDLHDPAIYQEYFQRLYEEVLLDKHHVQRAREALDYPGTASRYRLIQNTIPVVVQYGNGWQRALSNWRKHPSREAWRSLQPFIVNLYQHELRSNDSDCEQLTDNLYLWKGRYDSETHRGIRASFSDPSDLIV